MRRDRIIACAAVVAVWLPGAALAGPDGTLPNPIAALATGAACEPTGQPEAECDGVDDDCDGVADEDYAPTPTSCGLGACTATGETVCVDGTVESPCTPGAPDVETCNGLDDDCDGAVDDGNPDGGAACTVSGQQGACAPGVQECRAGILVCAPNEAPSTELCVTSRDEDCDGQVDEADCACAPGRTMWTDLQTRRTSVKLSDTPRRDKLTTNGEFAAPGVDVLKPAAWEVGIRIDDATGLFYEGVLPPGSVVASSSGHSFKLRDRDGVHAGLVSVKLGVRELAGRYTVKAQNLDLPGFEVGTARVTLRVGAWCFVDVADECGANAPGTTVKCR